MERFWEPRIIMTSELTTLTDTDFLQEQLDFSNISPAEFENLVFTLLDEMGFQNIEWRKGGEGNSATDGGRDLEAAFWNMQPAGTNEQKYWFEVKFRTGNLERIQVKETLLNAAGRKDKDFMVIVTNSTISNPTLDWVREFQQEHVIPKAIIWQGHELERLLRRNPRTLARFLPLSLSFSGRCKVMESKFSNLMMLPSGDELSELWSKKDRLEDNYILTLAAVLTEQAYGDLTMRPWGMAISKEHLFYTTGASMMDFWSLASKYDAFNRDQSTLMEGMVYLIGCVAVRTNAETAATLLYEPESLFEVDYEMPTELNFKRYEPLYQLLFDQLAEQCSTANYCSKLSYLKFSRSKSKIIYPDGNLFFRRYLAPQKIDTNEDAKEGILIINSKEHECELGLIAPNQRCPLGETEEETPKTKEALLEKLTFARSVLIARSAQELEEGT